MFNKAMRSVAGSLAIAAAVTGVGVGASSARAATPSATHAQTVTLSSVETKRSPSSNAASNFTNSADVYSSSSAAAARSGAAKPDNVVVDIAKKALIKALRIGGAKLPAKLAPYALKIADVLDEISNIEEIPLQMAFLKAGMPPDVAHDAATWVVLFLGV